MPSPVCFHHPRSKLPPSPPISRDTFFPVSLFSAGTQIYMPGLSGLQVIETQVTLAKAKKRICCVVEVAFSRAGMASSVTGPRGSDSTSELNLFFLSGGRHAPCYPHTPVLSTRQQQQEKFYKYLWPKKCQEDAGGPCARP